MNDVTLECHCLYREIDTAIPALFELPGIPIADSQISRACSTLKRMVRIDSDYPLHFKARFNPRKGEMVIAQFFAGRLFPMWGIRGLPTVVS